MQSCQQKHTHRWQKKTGKASGKIHLLWGKKREYIESENSESKYPHLLTALCFQCSNPLSLSMWLMSCTNWSSLSLLGIPLWKEYWMSAELEREKCSAKQHLAKAIIYPAGGFSWHARERSNCVRTYAELRTWVFIIARTTHMILRYASPSFKEPSGHAYGCVVIGLCTVRNISLSLHLSQTIDRPAGGRKK